MILMSQTDTSASYNGEHSGGLGTIYRTRQPPPSLR